MSSSMFNEVIAKEVTEYLGLCLKADRAQVFELYHDKKILSFGEFTKGYLAIEAKIRIFIDSKDKNRVKFTKVQQCFQNNYLDSMFFTDGEIDYLMDMLYDAICDCGIDGIPTHCDYRLFMTRLLVQYQYNIYNGISKKYMVKDRAYEISKLYMILSIWKNCSKRTPVSATFIKNNQNIISLYGYDNELCFSIRNDGHIERGDSNFMEAVWVKPSKPKLLKHTASQIKNQLYKEHSEAAD